MTYRQAVSVLLGLVTTGIVGVVLASSGCASTAPFTVQFCPGHPKAFSESDRSRHVCHLGDKLGLWRTEQRQKIREGFQR